MTITEDESMSDAKRVRANAPKRKPRHASEAELRAATVEAARAELREIIGRDIEAKPVALREVDPDEERVGEAIAALARAVDGLESAATSEGRGRLATWARSYAMRIAADVRAMRVPWTLPEHDGATIVRALVWRVYVDRRDVLGIGREPTIREVALLALVRGYWPDLSGSRVAEMTPAEAIKRACSAVRAARRHTDT